jgi:putative transposase
LIGSGELSGKKEKESRVKEQYQIKPGRARKQFIEWAKENPVPLQLTIPTADVVELAQHSLGDLLRHVGRIFIETVMESEVEQLVGKRSQADPERHAYRWGKEGGYCVIDGQKVPLEKPRVRSRLDKREVTLGSYELFQRASLMEETVWQRIMHGLTMRGYKEVTQQFADAYGLEKSTISEHFIEASRKKLEQLQQRRLDKVPLLAMFLDGTIFKGECVVVAIGVDRIGHKLVLGLRQGTTENATVVSALLGELQERGVDFSQPRLYVLDGSKALRKAVQAFAGEAAFIQRCQLHKIRNVIEHLPEEKRHAVRYRMRSAYAQDEHADALQQLQKLEIDLEQLNSDAAHSLREGMEETLTVLDLRVPLRLRRSLATTNTIESGFSVVETICRQVKRWQGRDHRQRWVASALLYAESRWTKIHGYRHLPQLAAALSPASRSKAKAA